MKKFSECGSAQDENGCRLGVILNNLNVHMNPANRLHLQVLCDPIKIISLFILVVQFR